MNESIFENFQKRGAIKLKPWRPRRFTSSVSNWKRSFWGSSKSNKAESTAKVLTGDAPAVAATTVAVASLIKGGAQVSVMVGGTVGAVLTGPILGAITGLIGLGFMVHGAYSNRDDAHDKLGPFVYNLITNKEPIRNIHVNTYDLKEAAKHAGYLMKEGTSQFAIMGKKLEEKQNKFEKFWNGYIEATRNLHGDGWKAKKNFIDMIENTYLPGPKSSVSEDYGKIIVVVHIELNKQSIDGAKLLDKNLGQGGVIFEFMRRLIKVGNYLQCADIISLATYNHLGFNHKKINECNDPFKDWIAANEYRQNIKIWSDLINENAKNYKRWEQFLRKYPELKIS